MNKIVSVALRNARERRGFTQQELAEKLGLATEVYGRLERGYSLPSAQTLARLSRALGVSTDELLGIGGAESEPDHSMVRDAERGEREKAELRRIERLLAGASRRALVHLRWFLVEYEKNIIARPRPKRAKR